MDDTKVPPEQIVSRDGTLTLSEIDTNQTVWLDEYEDEFHFHNHDGRTLAAWDEIDLTLEYGRWQNTAPVLFQPFLVWLKDQTYEPDEVDDVGQCADCSTPWHNDDLYSTNRDHDDVCDECLSSYYYCGGCEEQFDETTTVSNDEERCERCLERSWSWCENCDEYYHHDDGHGHEEDGCDEQCESPQQRFEVRNDGLPPLANDTRTQVTLPAGEISTEGIDAIRERLREEARKFPPYDEDNQPTGDYWRWANLAMELEPLGNKWQTKEGNFTKRLSRQAYKTHSLKMPPALVSEIGNIASEHSQAVDHQIEVTRNLNLSAEDFAHEESCWWQSYYASRCTLKTNGGFGLRTFTEVGSWTEVKGRAWVMPLRYTGQPVSVPRGPNICSDPSCCKQPATSSGGFVPTFDTLTPDAFIVFNGYGNLSGYTAARIVAHMAGMTYRKVSFSASPMYVNSDSGYLIAPEEIAQHFTDGSLALNVDQHSDLFENERGAHAESKEMAHV